MHHATNSIQPGCETRVSSVNGAPRTPRFSQTLADALLDSAAQAIIAVDAAGNIALVNRHAEAMFGYTREDLIGASMEILVPKGKRLHHTEKRTEYFREPHMRPMGNGMDLFARRKDGTDFPVEIGLSYVESAEGGFAIAFVTDITPRKQLEKQLMHAQKMEAIGRLAGGVAHDFNNMLMVISGHGTMALERLPLEDPSRSHLQAILAATNRAATLTAQLLAFGRRQTMRPEVINVNSIIRNTEPMLHPLIGEDITLDILLQPDVGNMRVDPSCIEQTIVNLVINSRDAMPEGGRITIETGGVFLDQSYAGMHAGVQPGEFVMIAVTDTGHGMDAEVRNRIFEPFFTTKAQGKGTGLGLASVYGMIQQAGGDIWVYSEPGKGTTFKLYFPKVIDAVNDRPASAAIHVPEVGRKTILVVEDEPSVRGVTIKMLHDLGYETLEAAGGADAIELSGSYEGTISMLLTDVVMPQMNGQQLAEALACTRPEMKVLYVSGYTENTVTGHGILDSDASFLPKPFSRDVLAAAVRDVLGRD